MTSRTYDVILKVANATNFKTGNTVMGNLSLTVGYIAAVDTANNILKVKLANTQQEFRTAEMLLSNVISTTSTANSTLNTTSLPFQAANYNSTAITANSTISSITPSSFIAEKNAFTQNPIVRLYSVYYPGEWYPPNEKGNPTGAGTGYAWPSTFPITFPLRIAEIVGDLANDTDYKVIYNGVEYTPYPINISGLEQASDGKVNELSLSVYNIENNISALVENPYLVGYNTTNSIIATVNGELVKGIDPRTVGSNATSSLANVKAVSYYGRSNAPFDKYQTEQVGGTWQALKIDTRDLLGAAVELKTTFANFLDYWPEYSKVESASDNIVTMLSSLPYRVGDILTDKVAGHCNVTIQAIQDDTLIVNRKFVDSKSIGAQTGTMNNMIIPTATNLYINSSTTGVYQYSGINYDPSSMTFVRSKTLSEEASLTGIYMTPDGNNLYTVGSTGDNVRRYTLSTPFNISTTTYVSNLYVGALESNPFAVALDTAGSNLYVMGTNSDRIFKYTLSTPFDITTATISSNISIGSAVTGETSPAALHFRPNGNKFWILGTSTDKIFQFDMSTSWDITTATLTGNTYIGNYDGNPRGLALRGNGTQVLFGGQTSDQIYSIPLDTAWDITSANTQASNTNEALYIINPEADTASYQEDVYKIDQLEGLNEQVANFGLVSWLQYFKIVTPKRKYYKNTCQWLYKGPECQYPGPGGLPIPGTSAVSSTKGIAANNMVMPTTAGDVCAKSLAACTLRNNAIHYGGFPGVGRTVPQM